MFVLSAYSKSNIDISAYVKVLPNKGIAWTNIQRASMFSFENIEIAYSTILKDYKKTNIRINPCFILELHPDLNEIGLTEIATLITNNDFVEIVNNEKEAKDEFILMMKDGANLATYLCYMIDIVQTNNKCIDTMEEFSV